MTNDRFARQELLFGAEGQARLAALRVGLVGLGGLGSHLAQQLAYLGVRRYVLVDRDAADPTSMNRLIGSLPEDAATARLKIAIAARLITSVDPDAEIEPVDDSVISTRALDALRTVDVVVAGVDREGVRFVLNEFCAAYDLPYVDVATDVVTEAGAYGGRVVYAFDRPGSAGCLYCLGVLDMDEVREDLESEAARAERVELYGVPVTALRRSGPSVVTINGVLASLAATELMRATTGLGTPQRHLVYRGEQGKVFRDASAAQTDCYYCSGLRADGDAADVYRYVRQGLGERL